MRNCHFSSMKANRNKWFSKALRCFMQKPSFQPQQYAHQMRYNVEWFKHDEWTTIWMNTNETRWAFKVARMQRQNTANSNNTHICNGFHWRINCCKMKQSNWIMPVNLLARLSIKMCNLCVCARDCFLRCTTAHAFNELRAHAVFDVQIIINVRLNVR